MTLSELYTVLNGASASIPVSYGNFPEKEKAKVPYIIYNVAYTNNFSADCKVYKKISHIDIHLFTKGKDTTSEAALETALANASLFWNYSESYESDEEANHLIYEVEIDG